MMYWIRARWLDIVENFQMYLSWQNGIRLIVTLICIWLLHGLMH